MKHIGPTVPALATVVLLVLTSIGVGQAVMTRSHPSAQSPTPAAPPDPGATELVAAQQSLSAGFGPSSDHASDCRRVGTDPRHCLLAVGPSAAPGSYHWTEYPSLPTGRTGSLLAYDPIDGYAVLFGGFECTPVVDCGGWLNDTWAFSQGVWTNLTTTASIAPTFRPGSEMVWDGADGYVLLVTTTNTTWSFVGGVWAQVVTANGPGARNLPGLTYDAADGYVVLFGGAGLNSPVGQTWTYRAAVWSQLNTSTSPWNRNNVAFTYDASDGYAVLFGGTGIVSGSYVVFNDTWTFLGGNWTLLPSANGPSPSYSSFDAYGYDPLTSSIVAVIYPAYYSGNYLWEFAGGVWTQINGTNQSATPLFATGVYDALDAEFLFVSGGSWFYYGFPYWITTFSLTNLTWAQIGTTPEVPTSLGYSQLVNDPAEGGLLLTDGQTTLRFENGSWVSGVTQSTTGGCMPSGLVYDAADGYVLLFCLQTWKFQGGNWTQLPQYPTDTWPSGAGVMSYDTADRCVVMYGAGYLNETWTWSAGNWTNVTNPLVPNPPFRQVASLADDPVDGYVVLFGGYIGVQYTTVLNDTWTFSGGTWSRVSTSVAPSPRGGATMAFDEVAGYDLLFGGDPLHYYGPMDQDTWSFAGGNWTNLAPSAGSPTQPQGRSGALMGFDPTSGLMLLLGGYSNDPLSPSEWFWGPATSAGGPVISSFRSQPGVTDLNVSVLLRATILGGAPPLQYAYTGLPSGCATVSAPTLMCQPLAVGLFTVGLAVTDATGNSSQSSLHLTVNSPPQVDSFTIVPATIQLGQTVGIDATFAGGTAPFSIAFTGLPPGCPAPSTPVFACVPSAAGNFSVRVSERDTVGLTATGSANLSVAAPPGIGSFQISGFSVAPTEVTVGGTVVVSTVTLGGSAPLAFAYAGLPGGCHGVDAAAFFCTPTQAGQFTIQVEASDQTPLHLFATALLLVEPAVGPSSPSAPRIASFLVSPASVALGGTVSFQVNATGGTPPYVYSYSGVPPGCISTDGPTFACVPTLSGQWAVGVTVTDSRGYFAQAMTALTVAPQPSTPGTGTPGPTATPAISELILLVLVGILSGVLVAILGAYLLRRRLS